MTSCGKKNVDPYKTLRLNICDDVASFDPRLVRNVKDLTIVQQLYDGLTRMDANLTPQPAIAKEISISDDRLTYTFKLREAFWNNGDPVTAYDFADAWKQLLDPAFASDYVYMLYPIKNAQLVREGKCSSEELGISAVDEKILVVQLEAPIPYFLALTSFPTYYPVHQKSEQIFNGPFQIKRCSPQSELLLEKNMSYWDAESVNLDRISFSVIPDTNTELHLFEKHELDWLGQPLSQNISTDIIGKMRESGRLNSYPVAGTFWLKFNTEKPPFDQPKVRQALSYAINREEIVIYILQGGQSIATGPLPPSMRLNEKPYFKDGDREFAKQLFEEVLKENGGELPKITFHYPPSERNTKIVQLIQEQWRHTLGLEIQLEAVEGHLYRRNIRQGDYQVGTGDWIADFNDPLAFLELFKYRNDSETGSGMNDTGWQDEKFISLLDQALEEYDTEKRKILLREAERILVDAMVVAPIYHYAFDYIKNESVRDVVLSPLGTVDFKCVNITN